MASFVQNEIIGTEMRHGDKAVGTGIAQSHKQAGTDDATDPRIENSTNLTGEMMRSSRNCNAVDAVAEAGDKVPVSVGNTLEGRTA